LKTKKEVVNRAVEEPILKTRRRKILELEGKVEWTGALAKARKSRA
jgi:hypothetical protein